MRNWFSGQAIPLDVERPIEAITHEGLSFIADAADILAGHKRIAFWRYAEAQEKNPKLTSDCYESKQRGES